MRAIIILALLGCAFAANSKISWDHPMIRRGLASNSPRIVGGSPTTIEEYPYAVNFQYLFFGLVWIPWCGGTLITTRSILSAAHCFDPDFPSWYRARVGSSFSNAGGTLITAESIINHEEYDNPVLDNDVAIVWLSTPVTLSATVQTARIAGPNYILADNTRVETHGWGALYFQGASPTQLHTVQIYTINQELCAERYAYLKTQPGYGGWPDITDNMLCAGVLDVGGRDACQGDSGGPLAHDHDIIVGIVSWGYECADSFYPGVNARVSSLSDWIYKHGSIN